MASYERSGRAIIWHRRNPANDLGENIPTIEDILEAARQEFPGCCLANLQLISCGEDILMEEKMI